MGNLAAVEVGEIAATVPAFGRMRLVGLRICEGKAVRASRSLQAGCLRSQLLQMRLELRTFYLRSSRGGGGGVSPLSPVCDNTSFSAPMLDNMAEVSTGIKITLELLVRVMSRRLSM